MTPNQPTDVVRNVPFTRPDRRIAILAGALGLLVVLALPSTAQELRSDPARVELVTGRSDTISIQVVVRGRVVVHDSRQMVLTAQGLTIRPLVFARTDRSWFRLFSNRPLTGSILVIYRDPQTGRILRTSIPFEVLRNARPVRPGGIDRPIDPNAPVTWTRIGARTLAARVHTGQDMDAFFHPRPDQTRLRRFRFSVSAPTTLRFVRVDLVGAPSVMILSRATALAPGRPLELDLSSVPRGATIHRIKVIVRAPGSTALSMEVGVPR